jgi:hypothetical protein
LIIRPPVDDYSALGNRIAGRRRATQGAALVAHLFLFAEQSRATAECFL